MGRGAARARVARRVAQLRGGVCVVPLLRRRRGALAGRGATAGSRTRCTCRPRFGACGRWEKAPMRLRSAGHGAGGPLTELACAVLMQRPFLLRAAPRDAGARALAGYGGAGCVVWWVRLAALLAAAARRTWTRAASRAPRTPTRRGRRWRARRCRATPSSRRRRAPDFLRGADTWRWPARRVRRRCVAAIGAVGNRAIWSASLVATLQQRVGKLCARCV